MLLNTTQRMTLEEKEKAEENADLKIQQLKDEFKKTSHIENDLRLAAQLQQKEAKETINNQESRYGVTQLGEAATKGDAHAQVMLGRAYFLGEGIVKDVN